MLKILIADDELLARETIKYLLSQINEIATIYEASDGKSALQIFEQFKPNIVFLDIEMPKFSGLDVAKRLPKETSIIFVKAFNHFKKQISALENAEYLLKPFKDEEFFLCFKNAQKWQLHSG